MTWDHVEYALWYAAISITWGCVLFMMLLAGPYPH